VAEKRSDAAKQVFETAFGKTRGSLSGNKQEPMLDLEMMKDESAGAYEQILSNLRKWGRELQWPKEMADGYWEAYAETAEEVRELVEPFTGRGLWVFVRITRWALHRIHLIMSQLTLEFLASTLNRLS
jgi:hypothetical protein